MAAPFPPIKRFAIEDFSDQRSWIGKLFLPLNQILGFLSGVFNHGITFTDHLACSVKTVSFNNDGTALPLYVTTTLKTKPYGVLVVNAVEDSTSPATITNAVYASWEIAQTGQVKITNITGLTTGKLYKLTLLII